MNRNGKRRFLQTLVAASLAAGLLVAGAPASADDDDRPIAPQEEQRVRQSLESKGYKDVHDLELDDGRYEVDATHRDGYPVDLELHLTTLEILHEKRD
jgi:hypothetical protein